MFNITGLLDSLMAFDFAKAVIDDEIALMLKRIQRGLEFSEANMALDLIAKVGPGGMFMDHPHTLERMKTAAFLPDVADREGRQQWIEKGSLELLGPLMDANHGVLRKMGVSCTALDRLVLAARRAGAWGAKLSGGGMGGNMIALAAEERAERVAQALLEAGAARAIITEVD